MQSLTLLLPSLSTTSFREAESKVKVHLQASLESSKKSAWSFANPWIPLIRVSFGVLKMPFGASG